MKKGFILYKSLYEPIKALDKEQKGELMEAIFEYQLTGEIIELNPIVNMAFMFFKNQFDIDNVKYLEKCKKAKESVEKRWNKKDTNVYERIETNTDNTDKREKIEDNSKKKEEEREKIKEQAKKIYDLYPSQTLRNGKKCQTKSKEKNLKKLENYLNGKYTFEHLKKCIEVELSGKDQKNGVYEYLRGFDVFLNNLPDYEEEEKKNDLDESYIYYQWMNDPSNYARRIKKEEAKEMFEKQKVGGYTPVYLKSIKNKKQLWS